MRFIKVTCYKHTVSRPVRTEHSWDTRHPQVWDNEFYTSYLNLDDIVSFSQSLAQENCTIIILSGGVKAFVKLKPEDLEKLLRERYDTILDLTVKEEPIRNLDDLNRKVEKDKMFTRIENICSTYEEDIEQASQMLVGSGIDPEILEDHLEGLYTEGIYQYDSDIINAIVEAQFKRGNQE